MPQPLARQCEVRLLDKITIDMQCANYGELQPMSVQISRFFLVCGIILLTYQPLAGQGTYNIGLGSLYTRSAQILPRGHLAVTPFTQLYFRQGSGFNIYNFTGSVHAGYGLSRSLQASLLAIFYQDTNRGSANIPSEITPALKIGTLRPGTGSMLMSLQLEARIPLADLQNVPFQPYRSEKIGFGARGVMSYAFNPAFPFDGTTLNLSLGYWNHNDGSSSLHARDTLTVTYGKTAQELLYAIGLMVRAGGVQFFTDLYGSSFLQQPPTAAYSRENQLFLAPGMRIGVNHWFAIVIGADIRLYEGQDETDYRLVPRLPMQAQPNYSPFRINLGLQLTRSPGATASLMARVPKSDEPIYYRIREQRRDAGMLNNGGAGIDSLSDFTTRDDDPAVERQFRMMQLRVAGNPYYQIVSINGKLRLVVNLYSELLQNCSQLTWRLNYHGLDIASETIAIPPDPLILFSIPIHRDFLPGRYRLFIRCDGDAAAPWSTIDFELEQNWQKSIR